MSDLIQHYLPVFRHYLDRIDDLAGKAAPDHLAARLTPGSFSALENLVIAQGYVLRALCPLAGQAVPDLPEAQTAADLITRSAQLRGQLDTLSQLPTSGSDITHTAGHAELTQSPYDFIALYAAPNFFFHFNMAYAILRAQGCEIGKGDFDGFHSYPKGFSFVTGTQDQSPEPAQ
ncbi:hypothetical protein TRP8649_03213 [Pelagimonas phthalicica]|uniref:DUF1993 domain-containing protein n=1 Tax=Pelagimonas phthalicica TaxID=1037362 RepID=A0A238JGK4_9RHOB|nr:DUF1993 family protein [Pelagimonas phthalicica]TDS92032.1 hypothetical protein CLV87_3214 [Pelagimonas phthalicica]SMX29082.1 hypothetical protein TRP8649_03213 [Pelagimonas phthalicica]